MSSSYFWVNGDVLRNTCWILLVFCCHQQSASSLGYRWLSWVPTPVPWVLRSTDPWPTGTPAALCLHAKGFVTCREAFFPPWSLRSTCKVLEAGQSTCWLIMSQSFKWKQTPCYTRTDLSPLMSQAQGSSQPCLLAFAFHQHAPLPEGVYVLCVNPLPLGCPSPTIVLDILRQCWILGKVVMVIFIFGSSSFVLFSS